MNLIFISLLACSHACSIHFHAHTYMDRQTHAQTYAHTHRKHTTHPRDTQINVIFETRTYERMVMQVLACPRVSNSCPSAKEFSWLLGIFRVEILGPNWCP
jgi:hypothetical protein